MQAGARFCSRRRVRGGDPEQSHPRRTRPCRAEGGKASVHENFVRTIIQRTCGIERKSSQMKENGSEACHSMLVGCSFSTRLLELCTFCATGQTWPCIILINSRCNSRSCSPSGSAWPRESHSCCGNQCIRRRCMQLGK